MGELIEKLNCCGGGPPKGTLQIKKKWKIDEINFDFLLFCCASRGAALFVWFLGQWALFGGVKGGSSRTATSPQRRRAAKEAKKWSWKQRLWVEWTKWRMNFIFVLMESMKMKWMKGMRVNETRVAKLMNWVGYRRLAAHLPQRNSLQEKINSLSVCSLCLLFFHSSN